MVSVQKTYPIPQLSIIVPIGRDLVGFEATLISVLENRPEGCEILVPHDGSYSDPFDLGDEVRFVVGSGGQTVELVVAATNQARGRFVHVLAEGLRASCGWTEAALQCFDHFDTGAVSPVIRSAATQRILAAGWVDHGVKLCANAGQGTNDVDSSVSAGAFLPASFWRRDVLRGLHRAFDGRDVVEVSVAYQHLLRTSGWRSQVAPTCTVLCDSERLPWQATSFGRGLRLRAIRHHFMGGGWSQSIVAGCQSAIGAVIHPGSLLEAIGQGFAPTAASNVARLVHVEELSACDDQDMIVAMPQRSAARVRRAA